MKLSFGAVVMGAVFALTLGVRAGGIAQQSTGQQPAGQPPAQAAPQGPLAPEKFKNIQVLKDLPADQLDGVMRFMAASLGVNCEFCHVTSPEGNWPMEKDDKRSKQTTRQMIEMTRAINAQSFKGQATVNCASCHHGLQEPNRIPPLAVPFTPEQLAAAAARAQAQAQTQAEAPGGRAGAPPAGGEGRGRPGGRGPARPTEAIDQIVDKYIQALGGRPALERLQSRVMRGTLTNRAGQSMTVTVEEKMPGKYRQTIDTPAGPAVHASNGTTAWQQNAGLSHEVTILFEQQEITRLADLGLPLQLKDRYQNLMAARYARLDDKDVILVAGRTAPSVTEQLYFDRNSGLLLRRVISTRTAMGNLPEQIDYSDYRDVKGVKVPFQIVRASWDYLMTQNFTDVKLNVPVDDARFEK